MASLGQDFRFAVRLLVGNPGFSAVAILTLALGIGVNSAIFSVADQLLLRPLPVEEPDRLIALRSPGPQWGNIMSDGDNAASFSHPVYRALAQRGDQAAELLARFTVPLSVSVQGQAERAAGELVSGNYFQALRVEPAAGRLFTPQDDEVPGGHPVAVLAHGYWMRRFERDPSIVGRTILINGHLMTVTGVAQAGFGGVQTGRLTDVFIPIHMKAQMTPHWDGLSDWRDYWLTVLGRLRPGVSRQAAAAALTAPYQALLQEQVSLTGDPPDGEDRQRFLSKPIQVLSASSGRPPGDDLSAPLAAVFGMVGLVLLIACANVANLLIAQGVSRRHEISVRLALGGSRIRLLRQLLVECLVLAVPGAAAGLLLAMWTSHALFAEMTGRMGMQGVSAQLDLRMLGFSLGITLLAVVLCGLLPALRSTRPDLLASLKGWSGSAGKQSMRLRQALVVSQIALTMTLLVTAGLLARSFYNITRTNLGLDPQHVLQFSVDPELNGYTVPQTLHLAERLSQTLGGLPGVLASSSARIPVMSQGTPRSNVTIEGYEFGPGERDYVAKNWIGRRFFFTLGLTLLSGRSFNDQDRPDGPRVAVINQTMASLYFQGRSAVGSRFGFGKGGPESLNIEIVGVVQDSKHSSAREQAEPFV
ncbi:MAG: ABC transporter permease, partial [Acidobacteriota bacterium]